MAIAKTKKNGNGSTEFQHEPPIAAHAIHARTRIVIADSNTIFRSGLRKLLDGEQDFLVVGEAYSVSEAAAVTRLRQPDLVLLDVAMPGMSGLDIVDQLHGLLPGVKVLLLAPTIEKPELIRALQRGARGVVLKATATDLLFKSIRAVMAGEYWVGRETVGDLVEILAQAPEVRAEHPAATAVADSFGLTPREREIVAVVLNGCSNREIANRFQLSEDTVKHHLTNIFNKTGASTRLELALFALHHRLVDQQPVFSP